MMLTDSPFSSHARWACQKRCPVTYMRMWCEVRVGTVAEKDGRCRQRVEGKRQPRD